MLPRPGTRRNLANVLPVLAVVLGTVLSAGVVFAGLPARGPMAAPPPKAPPARAAKGDSQPRFKPRVDIGVGSAMAAPRKPSSPAEVLYDQYDNPGFTGVTSQNFEAAYDGYDSHAADDFVVPKGDTWTVDTVEVAGAYTGGIARSVNVYFYANDSFLPGNAVFTATNVLYTPGPGDGDLVIPLSPPAVLPGGAYWLEVQANQDLDPSGQWFWRDRRTLAYAWAAWRNPGGAFFTGCTDWDHRGLGCFLSEEAPDQVFRLSGSINGTPSATVTGTPPTSTSTSTPAITPTVTGTHEVPSPVATQPPGPFFTPTPSVTAGTCGANSNYVYTQTNGISLVPGTDLVPGSQCDECVATIELPFSYNLYGQSFDTATAGDNGTLGFVTNFNDFKNFCLPTFFGFDHVILPLWTDMDARLNVGAGLGIYTSVSGSAPNRIFNIEWRSCLYNSGSCGGNVNFEVRLYEGQDRFDLVYGQVTFQGGNATVGVERSNGGIFTEYECFDGGLTAGLQVAFTQPPCGTSTPTITGTRPTDTATRSPTLTRSPTPTVCSVTINGSIDQSDPTQAGRITPDFPTSCAFTNFCPFVQDLTPRHYDAYTFFNNSPSAACVTVSFAASCVGNGMNSVAYLGSFDPSSLCTNYLGDSASFSSSGTYSFSVPGRASFVVVVHEITPNAGCTTYSLIVSGASCVPTPTGTPPTATVTRTRTTTRTATRTPTATPTPDICGPNSNYAYSVAQGIGMEPGTNLVPGSQCDECTVGISLPFTYNLYGVGYTSAYASDNGTLRFLAGPTQRFNTCLPFPPMGPTIFPHWADALTTNPGGGIYTSVTGIAPNRTFNIEWRGAYPFGGGTLDYEVRLYENQTHFDLVYGQVDKQGWNASVGVQRDGGLWTQYECFGGGLLKGLEVSFTQAVCGTPTPTPTGTPPTATRTRTRIPTRTGTPTSTNTATPTATPTVCGLAWNLV
ncbi:MAG: hypothetical protein ACJ78Q_20660, partial [Chloroflexia bacterium]